MPRELPAVPPLAWSVLEYIPLDPRDALLDADADLLAAVALSEDPRALDAVMWTVVNRARRRGWSLVAVAAEPEQFHGWVRGVDPTQRWRDRWSRRAMREARQVALGVLGGRRRDPTGGATHFHREGTYTPLWAPPAPRWRGLGSHAFYRAALK